MENPKLQEKIINFFGFIPTLLFIFGSAFLVLNKQIRKTEEGWNFLSCVAFAFYLISFVWWLIALVITSFKKEKLKREYSIKNLHRTFELIWINGTGYLIEKEGRLFKARWISSWQTASDLEFLGLKSEFVIDDDLKNLSRLEQIKKVLNNDGNFLKFRNNKKIEELKWGDKIHTSGILGS